MSDLIDRQAAIDAVNEWLKLYVINRTMSNVTSIQDILRQLPSAQLEKMQLSREDATFDCISRQAAIDAVLDRMNIEKHGRDAKPEEIMWTLKRLPSAQPEPIRINLNEPINVKLTDWGKEIYYHQYDRINQIAGREIFKPKFPKEDENGYTEFQLWCFMELYGEHMGMTLPNVIKPLEIVYER